MNWMFFLFFQSKTNTKAELIKQGLLIVEVCPPNRENCPEIQRRRTNAGCN